MPFSTSYALPDGARRRRPSESKLPNLPTPRRRPMPPRPAGIPGGVEPTRMPGLPPESSLPELATPQPIPTPTGIPGGISPPAINRQSRSEEYHEARDAYLQKTPGRFKSGILSGLRGLGPGLASGGVAGALGGFLSNAAFGAINPRAQREQQFEEQVMPQIGRRWQLEDADRAREAGEADRALKTRETTARIGEIESQTLKNQRPDYMNTPGGALNTSTGRIAPNTAPPGPPEFDAFPGGTFSRRTGEIKTPAADKEPPKEALAARAELDALKQAAEDAWRRWSQPDADDLKEGDQSVGDTPERKEGRRVAATQALRQYNDAVKRFGEVYGKWFETGGFADAAGNQGWSYAKRRQGGPAAPRSAPAKPMASSRPTGGPSREVTNLNDLENQFWR